MQTIYADGIANIALIDGIVRMDLVNITHVEKEKMSVRPVAAVALSVPALLRSYEQLTGVINKMVEQGLIKKEEVPAPVSASVEPKN